MPVIIPTTNILNNDTHYRISVFLPGVQPGDLSVNVKNNHISIDAFRSEKDGKQKYSRKFRLGNNLNLDAIDAKLSLGVLDIQIPILNHSRKIDIVAA